VGTKEDKSVWRTWNVTWSGLAGVRGGTSAVLLRELLAVELAGDAAAAGKDASLVEVRVVEEVEVVGVRFVVKVNEYAGGGTLGVEEERWDWLVRDEIPAAATPDNERPVGSSETSTVEGDSPKPGKEDVLLTFLRVGIGQEITGRRKPRKRGGKKRRPSPQNPSPESNLWLNLWLNLSNSEPLKLDKIHRACISSSGSLSLGKPERIDSTSDPV
ncbi:6529_t:CDS:2, partial [Acaulospora colombiana]